MGRTLTRIAFATWLVAIGACSTTNMVGSRGDASIDSGGRPPAPRVDECGNGIDDDRNGRIDDRCPCGVGETQTCFAGAASSRDVGACTDGIQTCRLSGVEWGDWGDSPCVGGTAPAAEQCDGLDHDCDGARDEDCPCTAGMMQTCGLEFMTAPCHGGTQTCGADGTWSGCEGAVGPSPDVCDGADNDCDGTPDEGCSCVPEPEACRDGIDNDCDGEVDEMVCTPDWMPDAGVPPPTDAGPCDPALTAPRLIAPLSTSRVTSQRPQLRWRLPSGADGARVEICADRACATIVTSFDTLGEAGAPPVDLTPRAGASPSLVYYWRARSTAGGSIACTPSAPWEFFVPHRSAPLATAWGSVPDYNGDGFADMAVVDSRNATLVYYGSAAGLPAAPSLTIASAGAESVATVAGDLDGDGFADLAVSSSAPILRIFRGGPTGVAATPVVTAPRPRGSSSSGSPIASGGDVNGDGYADLVVASGAPTEFYVYYGSASGIAAAPSTTIVGAGGAGMFVSMIGDVNGDGLTDVFSGWPLPAAALGWVYYGALTGLPSTPSVTLPLEGGASDHHVRLIGDVNGDGYADVMSSYRHAIFHGSATGLATTPTSVLPRPTAPGVALYVAGLNWVGAGDVNADGFDDVAFTINDGEARRPTIPYSGVYSGSAAGLVAPAAVVLPIPPEVFTGGFDSVSGTLRVLGDVDGDGHYDLAHHLEGWVAVTPTDFDFIARGAPGGVTISAFPPPAGTRFMTRTNTDFAHSGL